MVMFDILRTLPNAIKVQEGDPPRRTSRKGAAMEFNRPDKKLSVIQNNMY